MKHSAFSLTIVLLVLLGLGAYRSGSAVDLSYELSWEDNFQDTKLDTAFWTPIVGNGCPQLCGWGNNELQYYTNRPTNLRIEDGKLIIEAHKELRNGWSYTSAKVVTKNKADWKWGRVEIRAKLPYGKGTWPAIWMLPSIPADQMRWPHDGEIDIMEHVGYNQGTVYGTVHTGKYNGVLGTQKSDSIFLSDAHTTFHDYSIEWTPNEVNWYVDGDQYFQLRREDNEDLTGWPFNKYEYHLIINLAVGGNWGGKHGVATDIWPQTFEIEHVRYFKLVE